MEGFKLTQIVPRKVVISPKSSVEQEFWSMETDLERLETVLERALEEVSARLSGSFKVHIVLVGRRT